MRWVRLRIARSASCRAPQVKYASLNQCTSVRPAASCVVAASLIRGSQVSPLHYCFTIASPQELPWRPPACSFNTSPIPRCPPAISAARMHAHGHHCRAPNSTLHRPSAHQDYSAATTSSWLTAQSASPPSHCVLLHPTASHHSGRGHPYIAASASCERQRAQRQCRRLPPRRSQCSMGGAVSLCTPAPSPLSNRMQVPTLPRNISARVTDIADGTGWYGSVRDREVL